MSKKSIDSARPDSNRQKELAPERRKLLLKILARKQCLEVAAQIRQELTGRKHSNSTELAAEDRQR